MMALDRSSLAFAATQMNPALGFDASVYGLAIGLYFITYGICQVPSAIIGLRVGMRWWFAFITAAWGAVAACFALVRTAGQLYAMRLLLGAFEAGAAPCAFHTLSAFFPEDR